MEDIDRRLIADIAESVPVERLEDFYRLTEKSALDEREATELVELVSNALVYGDPDLDNDPVYDRARCVGRVGEIGDATGRDQGAEFSQRFR